MQNLYILYDARCPFCRRCRMWMLNQPAYFELFFLPTGSPEARSRLPGIQSYEGSNELITVTEEGAVYQGPTAFIMCLYALVEYREWSLRLATPALLPFARNMFEMISNNRMQFSKWLNKNSDEEMARSLERYPPPVCGGENMACLQAAKQRAIDGMRSGS